MKNGVEKFYTQNDWYRKSIIGLKILTLQDPKYIKHVYHVYNIMLQDVVAHPNKWAVLVRNLLSELGFYEVWVQQRVGNYNVFISLSKQG